MQRAQTSTEYLILAAAVLLVVLIAALILAEGTGTAGLANQRNNAHSLQSLPIGITQHSSNSTTTSMVLTNNLGYDITITAVSINGSWVTDMGLPSELSAGTQTRLSTSQVATDVGAPFRHRLIINYTTPSYDSRQMDDRRAVISGVNDE